MLNQPPFDKAQLLICGADFGVGSSREHAVIALKDFGMQCLVAPSFGDIFYNNCLKNGVLPALISTAAQKQLMHAASAEAVITVDLAAQTLTIAGTHADRAGAAEARVLSFNIAAHAKQYLLQGIDDIARTLHLRAQIESFEHAHHSRFPWLADRAE